MDYINDPTDNFPKKRVNESLCINVHDRPLLKRLVVPGIITLNQK